MTIVLLLVSLFFASVPPVALALMIWWMDRYEREPWWAVALAFLWGAFGATTLSIVLSLVPAAVAEATAGDYAGMLTATLAAPPIEELMKALCVMAFLLIPRLLDNTMDGIVYGSMAGLGFAATENLLYFMGAVESGPGPLLLLIVLRTLFTMTGHMTYSALMGACMGYVAARGKRPGHMMIAIVLGYAGAVALHAFWNLMASLTDLTKEGAPFLLGVLVALGTMASYVVVSQVALWRESVLLRRELEEEEALGVIPPGQGRLIASVFGRNRVRLASPSANPASYIRRAVRLAMEKARFRHRPTASGGEEITRLRTEVMGLQVGQS